MSNDVETVAPQALPNASPSAPKTVAGTVAEMAPADFEALLTRALCNAMSYAAFRFEEERQTEYGFTLRERTNTRHQEIHESWHTLLDGDKSEVTV